jgi:C1A family cysteine protease
MKKNRLFKLLSAAIVIVGLMVMFVNSCSKESKSSAPDGSQNNFDPQSIVLGCLLTPKEEYQAFERKDPDLTVLKSAQASTTLCTPAVGNQGSEGSCVSWGTAYAGLAITKGCGNRYSQEFVYNSLTTCSSNCSCGLYVSQALNLIKNTGTCLYNTMPSVKGCSVKPNATQLAEAQNYKVSSWYTVSINVANIKALLASGIPVIVGGPVNNAFEYLKNGAVLTTFTGSSLGGHCYCVVGYDDTKNAFKFMNSWGTSWASSGFGWINYNNINSWWQEAYHF